MDTDAIERLLALPTAGLGHWPTPLHRWRRFGAELGLEVWAKRDDVQGVTLAGNKVRKFDLVIGDALRRGFDTLVTTGATQSNSARTGAAAAAAVGMRSVLVLSGEEPPESSANLLIDRLVGADVRFAGDVGWRDLDRLAGGVVAQETSAGRRAFAAPVGCSSPLGTLGFAKAFLELASQCDELGVRPSAIVHTSTSGGTHAGLLVGRSLLGSDIRVVAVDAGAIFPDMGAACVSLAAEAASLIGHRLVPDAGSEVVTSQLGPGYGVASRAGSDALALLARTEAVLVDPVYSAKGLAGLVELTRADRLTGPVVFWHTGGYHALFDPGYGPAAVR